MGWRLSHHARVELQLRVYQSRVLTSDGRASLLRVVVDDTIEPIVLVTAYITSKMDKYWRHDEDLL